MLDKEKDECYGAVAACGNHHGKYIILKKRYKAKAIKVSTLAKLCEALDCQPGDLLEYRDCSCDNGENIVS